MAKESRAARRKATANRIKQEEEKRKLLRLVPRSSEQKEGLVVKGVFAPQEQEPISEEIIYAGGFTLADCERL